MEELRNQVQAYKNLIIISVGLLIIGYLVEFYYLCYAGVGLLLSGVMSVTITRWISFLWMKIAEFLGFINSKILLTLIYFLILCPLAFLARLFGSNKIRFSVGEDDSWYTERGKTYQKEDLEQAW